jgi:thiamine-monophosphate kinase
VADEKGPLAGEDALIQATFAPLAAGFPGSLGLKDDCAVLTPPAGCDLVLTTDAVAAGVHFFPDDAARDIAWKALAVNVSDLAAKGARPIAYLMSLSLPERPEQAWLDDFARGFGEAQAAFALALAGGDTDRRPGPLTVTVTAIGSVPTGRMVRRSTAKAGDALFLSGSLGDSALGLLLRREPGCATAFGLEPADMHWLVGRYLRPEPRLALAPHLLAFASAAMDVSDGLVKDCARLASASGLAASIEGPKLPFSGPARPALGRDPDVFRIAVTGGDDYEILAAIPQERARTFAMAAAANGVAVTEIGRLAAGTGVRVTALDGSSVAFESAGWDHFA